MYTGKWTARAAQDKYIVREPSSEDNIWWGEYNRPMTPDKFEGLFNRVQAYLAGENLTDTDYEQKKGYPMPGISGMVGLVIEF